ncbi:DUF1858 domain-containing protein [Vibrio sp. JC009]|uniref:DUF1858 domain-containing protein n=1 Tax=Vibrio sp. JC009 TaxID=2912314 RepID=UPI0023AFEA57|nr:DUF1858 domain-containing protein [Vibrio sp. JC009]WED23851.1 DUF1858 domain-containing protein [Vibrio sp. JC009]
MQQEWIKIRDSFKVKDVRTLRGNFLPSLLKQAQRISEGEGLCVVQSFEPIPLYSALEDLGFENYTDKVADDEYRAYFYRRSVKEATYPEGLDVPLKPTAIVNFNHVSNKLADVVVNFWDLIWGREDTAIDMRTRLLLSLANGVGAGRMRQATRELIKAYSLGVTVQEFDELFEMFAWNQGAGYFASEISPSSLFAAYKLIKMQEEKGMERSEVVRDLMDKFGEDNPDVSTFYKIPKSKNSVKKSEPVLSSEDEIFAEHAKEQSVPEIKQVKAEDKIADVITQYPFLKEILIARNKLFANLNNPVAFRTVGKFARLSDVARVSGDDVNELLAFINQQIEVNS